MSSEDHCNVSSLQNFLLNNQQLTCNSLEIFPLPSQYEVLYNGRRLVDHKIVRKEQQLGLKNNILQKYHFANVPSESMEENKSLVAAIHPIIDDWVLTQARNISIASVSILTGSTLLIGACCCGLLCLLCPPCRQCFMSACSTLCTYLYKHFTSKTYRLRKQNDVLRKENEKSRVTLEASMKEYNLVNQALQAFEEDGDIVEVVMNDQRKTTEKKMEDTNDGNTVHPDQRRVKFSARDEKATIHVEEEKGEKDKKSVSKSTHRAHL